MGTSVPSFSTLSFSVIGKAPTLLGRLTSPDATITTKSPPPPSPNSRNTPVPLTSSGMSFSSRPSLFESLGGGSSTPSEPLFLRPSSASDTSSQPPPSVNSELSHLQYPSIPKIQQSQSLGPNAIEHPPLANLLAVQSDISSFATSLRLPDLTAAVKIAQSVREYTQAAHDTARRAVTLSSDSLRAAQAASAAAQYSLAAAEKAISFSDSLFASLDASSAQLSALQPADTLQQIATDIAVWAAQEEVSRKASSHPPPPVPAPRAKSLSQVLLSSTARVKPEPDFDTLPLSSNNLDDTNQPVQLGADQMDTERGRCKEEDAAFQKCLDDSLQEMQCTRQTGIDTNQAHLALREKELLETLKSKQDGDKHRVAEEVRLRQVAEAESRASAAREEERLRQASEEAERVRQEQAESERLAREKADDEKRKKAYELQRQKIQDQKAQALLANAHQVLAKQSAACQSSLPSSAPRQSSLHTSSGGDPLGSFVTHLNGISDETSSRPRSPPRSVDSNSRMSAPPITHLEDPPSSSESDEFVTYSTQGNSGNIGLQNAEDYVWKVKQTPSQPKLPEFASPSPRQRKVGGNTLVFSQTPKKPTPARKLIHSQTKTASSSLPTAPRAAILPKPVASYSTPKNPTTNGAPIHSKPSVPQQPRQMQLSQKQKRATSANHANAESSKQNLTRPILSMGRTPDVHSVSTNNVPGGDGGWVMFKQQTGPDRSVSYSAPLIARDPDSPPPGQFQQRTFTSPSGYAYAGQKRPRDAHDDYYDERPYRMRSPYTDERNDMAPVDHGASVRYPSPPRRRATPPLLAENRKFYSANASSSGPTSVINLLGRLTVKQGVVPGTKGARRGPRGKLGGGIGGGWGSAEGGSLISRLTESKR